jgi:hypothetical protein
MSARINLGNIHAGITLGGGVDLGLDDVNVDADANVSGALDLGLDDIRVRELAPVRADAAVSVAVKELPVIRTDSNVDLGLDDIRIRELAPVRVELSMRPLRVTLPLSYKFCIELFGIPLLKFSLCGQGMAIAEEYQAREAEKCR